MSTAAPRSCLKPPLRNPWVAEDGGESSASSGQQQQQQQQQQQLLQQQQQQPQQQQQQQQQQQAAHGGHTEAHRAHDLLAHQYATPYQPPTSHPAHPNLSVAHSTHSVVHPSLTAAHPSLSGTHPSHSVAYTVTGAHPPVNVTRAVQGVGQHGHGDHGVVHSHTVHSLHINAHHGHPMSTTAHSVHSMPGTLQQPWVDPQMLWSTPTLPGVGTIPGGVFTVGGGGEGSCPARPPGVYGQPHAALHPLHHMPPGGGGGSSGQASTSGAGGGGWGVPQPIQPQPGVGGWSGGGGGRTTGGSEGSRCERCHYYCFRAAQAMFVAGIVTGFSLLVAGGIFHRRHVTHLQVLVYIGAMVSLVCVVLLVIFCAMNKDHRTRRGVSVRYPGPQAVAGDPEAVPLRAIDATNPVVMPSDLSHGTRPGDGGSTSSCMGASTAHTGCMVGANKQNMCCVGVAAAHNAAGKVMGSVNHGPVSSSEVPHHLPQPRHPPQRADDECEANQRYNRLWKQPTKAPSEAASKL